MATTATPKKTAVSKAATSAGTSTGEISILEVQTHSMEACIIGTSPLIMNRMSRKAWEQLLAPSKKSRSEQSATMKHDPITEFRDAPYIMLDPKAKALLGMMASGFKKSMCTAALRTPGVKKTEIQQLVYIPGEFVEVFGIPKVFMAITRSADIAKTPDVRTRAILGEWACRVTIKFIKPALREQSIANLLAAAGFLSGIGDWRQEKGSGSYGSFKICNPDDADFVRITKTMGREAQREALEVAEPYNDETSEMLAWYGVERNRRGFHDVAGGKKAA